MLPAGYVERPATRADLDSVTELLICTDVAEFGEPDWSRDDQIEEWANPRLDLALDTRVVHTADGTLLAYGYVTCRDDGADFDSDVYVHPDHDADGIEEHLMGFVVRRSSEQVSPTAENARVMAVVHAPNTTRAARYTAAGFQPLRHFWRMTTALPAVGLGVALSDAVTIRVYDGEPDLPAVHRVVTEAFREHFRSVALPYDEWVTRFGQRSGAGAGPWLLAELEGEVVGALLSTSTLPGIGWIRTVAVLPPARGRGIGAALLCRAFDDFATSYGATKVSLGVDADNATGAVGLYQRVGMKVERQFDFYAKSLVP